MSIPTHFFIFIKIIGIVPPLLFSVVIHEIAHGWAASKLGDPTAKQLGRITLNPIKHIDPVLTILTPAFLFLVGSPFIFGGAKPVPVNPMNFKNPRRGMAWVALAGPVSNFILAAMFLVAAKLYLFFAPALVKVLSPWILVIFVIWISQGFLINIVLGIFNLFPVPPLDGGRIAVGFLPIPIAKKVAGLERFGIAIVFALLLTGVMDSFLRPVLMFAQKMMSTVGFQ
jgi:Zn-dependent protease